MPILYTINREFLSRNIHAKKFHKKFFVSVTIYLAFNYILYVRWKFLCLIFIVFGSYKIFGPWQFSPYYGVLVGTITAQWLENLRLLYNFVPIICNAHSTCEMFWLVKHFWMALIFHLSCTWWNIPIMQLKPPIATAQVHVCNFTNQTIWQKQISLQTRDSGKQRHSVAFSNKEGVKKSSADRLHHWTVTQLFDYM